MGFEFGCVRSHPPRPRSTSATVPTYLNHERKLSAKRHKSTRSIAQMATTPEQTTLVEGRCRTDTRGRRRIAVVSAQTQVCLQRAPCLVCYDPDGWSSSWTVENTMKRRQKKLVHMCPKYNLTESLDVSATARSVVVGVFLSNCLHP